MSLEKLPEYINKPRRLLVRKTIKYRAIKQKGCGQCPRPFLERLMIRRTVCPPYRLVDYWAGTASSVAEPRFIVSKLLLSPSNDFLTYHVPARNTARSALPSPS